MTDDDEYRRQRAEAEGDLHAEADLLIRATNAAWVNLHWLLVDPDHPDRYALALAVLADPAAPERAERGEDAGIRSKGGHSDPTGDQAAASASDLLEARKHLADVSELIADTASFVRESVTRACYDAELTSRRLSLPTAIEDVSYVLKVPHTVRNGFDAYRRTERDEQARELSHAVDLLYRQTCTLRSLVLGHLRSSVRPPVPKPKQKPRLVCVDCDRHGVQSDVAEGSRKRCAKCLRFRKEYPSVAPTATMVRAWADGRERLTPGMIAEAVAASSPRKRRVS